MTEKDLQILYFLNERNEIIEDSLNKINIEFKKIKREITGEKNIFTLLGEKDKSKGCLSLLEEINNDIEILDNIRIDKEHEVKKIEENKYKVKEVYLFEEDYDFENINLKGLRIKNNYYKVNSLEDLIATVIKEIETNNYFIHYISEYQFAPFLILTDYNFHINSFPFYVNDQKFYVNKNISVKKAIKDLLGIIGRNCDYHYNDVSLITQFSLKRKTLLEKTDNKYILNFKNEKWSGKSPKYIVLKDKEIKVESWIDLFVKTLSLLKKDILYKGLHQKEILNQRKNFMYLKPDSLTRPKQIILNQDQSFYIRGNYSAKSIQRKLKFLLLEFNYNLSDFNIIIDNKKETI